ncbi:MAG: hydantoinase/oxoprolinase family protein [Alphaproteobacteria bacterium]|nr:hydantoinase/oxoprolinase family protein [Alphaproteobacteria bacterium]
MYRIGIDVGGTFTDVVAIENTGRVTLAKAPSTPQDQSIGVIDGLNRLAERLGLSLTSLLQQAERIVHGTTVATNALLEHKGARVGLLTTEGHRDVLEMREGLKPERYNLRLAPPEPLVPRHLRLGVRERLDADGNIRTPLNRRSLNKAIADLKAADVESVAVCYLHSYRDPSHEAATRAALAKALPDAYVSLSSEVLPQIKEFERVSTTVVNAYVGPILERYLTRLADRLRDAGYEGTLLIILSHGGVTPVAEAVRLAAGTVLSGPAGGVGGGRHSARLLGVDNLIPFDMGGTSSDISMIVNGEPTLSTNRAVANERVALPSLDIVTLGAGGGSIAHVDPGGVLHVGPQSAGADPGPACYGQGGTEPTVTDANLALGYLDAENFLGGRQQLDIEASKTAIRGVAQALGIDETAAAAGIHQVVNTNMAEGIRLISVRRGVDPRRFALLSFGGAAGLHVTDLARQLEIGRVIAPRVASVLSAWGMLASDLRFEVTRTHVGDMGALNADALRSLFADMEAEGRQRLAEWFDGPVKLSRLADMRYGEQVFEVDVPLDSVDWDSEDLMSHVAERFHARHEELFTYSLKDQEVVLVNARVAVVGVLPETPDEEPVSTGPDAAPVAHRRIYLEGWIDAPIYDLDILPAGQVITGPAVIESETTTALLRRGDRATVTQQRWLDIAVEFGSNENMN